MLGAFNPHKLGATPNMPNVSSGDILSMLQATQNSVDKTLSSVDKYGENVRSKRATDAMTQGLFKGLTPEEIQAKLLTVAGGSVNQETLKAFDALTQGSEKAADRKFTTDERVSGQDFRQALQGEQLASGERINQNNINSSEKISGNQLSMQEKLQNDRISSELTLAEKKNALDMLLSNHNQKINLENKEIDNKYDVEKADQKVRNEWFTNIGNEGTTGTKSSSSKKDSTTNDDGTPKLTDLDKIGIKALEKGELGVAESNVIESISKDMDTIWDRDMDDKTKTMMRRITTRMLSNPDGASLYYNYGTAGLKDAVYAEMEKAGVSFTDPVWNPFEKRSIQDNKKK